RETAQLRAQDGRLAADGREEGGTRVVVIQRRQQPGRARPGIFGRIAVVEQRAQRRHGLLGQVTQDLRQQAFVLRVQIGGRDGGQGSRQGLRRLGNQLRVARLQP